MSVIALTLNLRLGALLTAALGLGWRLERRLRALRDSHRSFTEAVEDLDRAALRAEQGLADLRAATDEAAETLAGRIEKAERLAERLDSGIARAAAREPQPEPAPAAEPLAAAPASPLRRLRDDLILEALEESPRERALGLFRERFASPAEARADLRAPAPPPSPFGQANARRSRARVDDDLFVDAPATASRASGAHR
jgi:hypothetical protein